MDGEQRCEEEEEEEAGWGGWGGAVALALLQADGAGEAAVCFGEMSSILKERRNSAGLFIHFLYIFLKFCSIY